jgi:hypothetical protein
VKLYPSDASVIPHPTRARRRFHAGVEFEEKLTASSHSYLLAACNSQQLLDGNSGSEHGDLTWDSRCQRRACKTRWLEG